MVIKKLTRTVGNCLLAAKLRRLLRRFPLSSQHCYSRLKLCHKKVTVEIEWRSVVSRAGSTFIQVKGLCDVNLGNSFSEYIRLQQAGLTPLMFCRAARCTFCCDSCNKNGMHYCRRIMPAIIIPVLLSMYCNKFHNFTGQHDCQTNSVRPPLTMIVLHQQVEETGNSILQDCILYLQNGVHTRIVFNAKRGSNM